MTEYIVLDYVTSREYPLGAFQVQPVKARTYDPRFIELRLGATAELYFDPELLDYIIRVDDSALLR